MINSTDGQPISFLEEALFISTISPGNLKIDIYICSWLPTYKEKGPTIFFIKLQNIYVLIYCFMYIYVAYKYHTLFRLKGINK